MPDDEKEKKKYDVAKVDWDNDIYKNFCEKGMLKKIDRKIMYYRIMGESIVAISLKKDINRATSTISDHISKLKKKYDSLHLKYPDLLPERHESEVEKWMDDTHNNGNYYDSHKK